MKKHTLLNLSSSLRIVGLAALLGAATVQVAPAQLLVEQTFNYALANGTNLVGNATGGIGFASPNWMATSGTGTFNYLVSNLSFGTNLANNGGSALISGSGRAFGSVLATSANASLNSTVYGAYLVNVSLFGNAAAATESRLNTTVTSGGASSYFRSLGDSAVSGAGVAYDGTAATGGSALTANTTFLVLSSFTNIGGNLSITSGVATQWILTQAQYDNFKLSGGTLTDAELNSATVGNGTTDVFSRLSETVTTGTGGLFNSSRAIQFAIGNTSATTQTATLDAWRYGTTLDFVTPIPEPATMALGVLGGLAVFAVRRRRRSHASLQT